MTRNGTTGGLSSFWEQLVACGGDVPCLLRLITHHVAEVIGEAAVLTIVSDDGTRLEPAITYHDDPEIAAFLAEVVSSGPYVIGEGVAGRVAAERVPAVLNDIDPSVIAELIAPHSRQFAEQHPIRALLIVPMVAGGELVGTLGAMRTESTARYEREDVLAIEALAERAALAIADARRAPRVLGPADYEAIYRNSIDGVMFTVPDGRILAANQAACDILGMSEPEICRRGREGILVADDGATIAALRERMRTGRVRAEIPMRRADGRLITADISSSVFAAPSGEMRACVIFRDVSTQVAMRHQLEQQAKWLEDQSERDPLTGLRNRRGFTAAATEALAIAKREGRPVQVLFFDIDNLKRVNDTRGHPAGDAMITRFARALHEETRNIDVSARIGGDEFVLVLFDADEEQARKVIQRIDWASTTLSEERLSFSVGITSTVDEPSTLPDLLARADRAMYEAKLRRRFGPTPF